MFLKNFETEHNTFETKESADEQQTNIFYNTEVQTDRETGRK